MNIPSSLLLLGQSVGACITTSMAMKKYIFLTLRDDKEGIWEPGKYCMPGGEVEDGESLSGSLVRELYEELDVSSHEFVINHALGHILYSANEIATMFHVTVPTPSETVVRFLLPDIDVYEGQSGKWLSLPEIENGVIPTVESNAEGGLTECEREVVESHRLAIGEWNQWGLI